MTAEPLAHEVDGREYVDRANRVQRLLDELTAPGAHLDLLDWAQRLAAVQTEVPELPLVIGVRYRIRMLGGRASTEAHHYRDGRGAVLHLDIPVIEDRAFLELEGVFVGRRPAPFAFAARPILFEVAGRLAMLTDSDVLRIDEVRA